MKSRILYTIRDSDGPTKPGRCCWRPLAVHRTYTNRSTSDSFSASKVGFAYTTAVRPAFSRLAPIREGLYYGEMALVAALWPSTVHIRIAPKATIFSFDKSELPILRPCARCSQDWPRFVPSVKKVTFLNKIIVKSILFWFGPLPAAVLRSPRRAKSLLFLIKPL